MSLSGGIAGSLLIHGWKAEAASFLRTPSGVDIRCVTKRRNSLRKRGPVVLNEEVVKKSTFTI